MVQTFSGEDEDVFTGFIGSGIVEQIEEISPLWPHRILMGTEDPMLDCSLPDFVSMMQVRKFCSIRLITLLVATRCECLTYGERLPMIGFVLLELILCLLHGGTPSDFRWRACIRDVPKETRGLRQEIPCEERPGSHKSGCAWHKVVQDLAHPSH